jgi:hypothetical protein
MKAIVPLFAHRIEAVPARAANFRRSLTRRESVPPCRAIRILSRHSCLCPHGPVANAQLPSPPPLVGSAGAA